jgi:hypothetical protein
MFRVGDRVCNRYHMSKEGVITEMRQVRVTAGNGAGAFSPMWVVKFITDEGEIIELKAQDVMRAN